MKRHDPFCPLAEGPFAYGEPDDEVSCPCGQPTSDTSVKAAHPGSNAQVDS